MKLIITQPVKPQETILVSALPSLPIIGFTTSQGLVIKGFMGISPGPIAHTAHQKYYMYRVDGLTCGVCYKDLFPSSLADCLKHPELDYYLFDNEKDLLKWLSA
jgi:hypothetical protein